MLTITQKTYWRRSIFWCGDPSIEAGAQAVRYTISKGYFESLTTGVVRRTPQTTSKVIYLSASAPAPMRMVLVT